MRWPMLFVVVLLAADVSIGQDSPALDASRPAKSQLTPVASPLGRYGAEQWVSTDDLLHRIWSMRVSLAVTEAPLEEVLQTLADTLECQLRIDRIALEDRGLKPDHPVTIDVRELTVGSVLDAILQEDDFAHIVEPGRLLITTSAHTEEQKYHHARYYPVGTWFADDSSYVDLEAVKQTVELIDPIAWEALGGTGNIEIVDDGLVIWQRANIHHRIHRLFSTMAAAKALPNDAYETGSLSIHPLGRTADAIRDKLRRTTISAEWESISVAEFAQFLETQLGVEVLIHEAALDEIGYSLETPLRGRWQEVTAENLLNDLFSRNLAWQVRGDFLEITTEEEKARNLDVRVYPVRDLIAGVEGLDPTEAKVRPDGFWCGSVMPRRPKLPQNLQLSSPGDRLIERFEALVFPADWEGLGGFGDGISSSSADCLVISHHPEAHQQIESLLHQFRQHRAFDLREAYAREASEVIVVNYPVPRGEDGSALFSEADIQRLASRIQQIAPSTWEDDQHYVESLAGHLLIYQRRDVQREIYRFLEDADFVVKKTRK